MEQIELQGQDSLKLKRKKTKKVRRMRRRRRKRKKLAPLNRIVSLKRIKYQPSIPNFNKTSKRITPDMMKKPKMKKRKGNKFS